ncbi:hypothetical protein FFE93_003875 [Yersinia sp. KBS0713]|uniref:Uncharacterized protein n=1 Tax=Yersinia bercovieri TaxID=634 RepID=A0A2G4U3P7_YERBE|nr:hypothetical protein CS533_08300 [Yersinia bercovieri]QDW32266.1 hypothetical protein FFE93_003875 [Yersinia sp. KBS0713]
MSWFQHQPINISKIRAFTLFLIMPNSGPQIALPHKRSKGLCRDIREKRTHKAFNMHWGV